jgi:DNA ligase (NAD+)
MNPQAESLVQRLRKAAAAYYETDTPIMSDADYDALVEELQAISPNHPFLSEIGHAPGANIVKLPVPMPSLDKRKPDSLKPDDIERGPYVLSEKLDGISALWVTGGNTRSQLLLRGNGLEGQDVSHCIGGIQGLAPSLHAKIMIRGELIVPKVAVQGTLARNWVNGILHQKTPSKEDLTKIKFIAYQVCEPNTLTRSQQMTWLHSRGFQVAWSVKETALTNDRLQSLFKERREGSTYECDGIVIGKDTVPTLTASNPKDAYAFKMPLDDQRAQTTVQEVEWASSRTGNWIPRIRFTPVKIGTATIEYCTGFHAQYVRDNVIGPGAVILVRRSGDVIPVCERVVQVAPKGWQQPPDGQWSWDDSGVHAKDTSTDASPEKLALEMAHQLESFGVEGFSKTTCKKLVDGGVRVLKDVQTASLASLQALIGKVNGEKLKTGLRVAMDTAAESQWIRAFLGWPKGFGTTRIEATLAVESDITKWPQLARPPKGQSVEAFAEVCKAVPAYSAWRATFGIAAVAAPSVPKQVQSEVPTKGFYVMTGFRDADLQTKLTAAGWKLQDKICKTTNVLLVADDAKETTKVKAARDAGIRILPRGQVSGLF